MSLLKIHSHTHTHTQKHIKTHTHMNSNLQRIQIRIVPFKTTKISPSKNTKKHFLINFTIVSIKTNVILSSYIFFSIIVFNKAKGLKETCFN